MDDQNKNLILATALSFIVLLVWFVLFPPPDPVQQVEVPDLPAATQADATATAPAANVTTPATEAVANAPRVKIDTPELEGSISLAGARIDDLLLRSYRETLAADSPLVRLFSPVGVTENGAQPYYAVFGWGPAGTLAATEVPDAHTLWQAPADATLTVDKPLTLTWTSPAGLSYARTISVDEHYMFTVTDKVTNPGAEPVSLFPYGIVARHGLPAGLQNFFVLHEGVVGRTDGELTELKYDAIADLDRNEREGALAQITEAQTDGWIGFTDKYWMSTLIPQQGAPFTSVVKYLPQAEIYQTETRQPVVTVAPGQSVESATRLFAGAKEWETIRNYQNEPGAIASLFGAKPNPDLQPVPGFIDSIDWGWFYFLTKPIFFVLHFLHGLIGNMGLAIIALTFVLKVLVLPLAYKSYVSMARMKELQPEMEALKERAGEDKQKLQREMMQLYKDKKVNPAAGCLPILIQIPIFFSLYKVIFVTIELRHAPFFGWLRDLSAPDPSSLFNLFGLLPWAAPAHGSLLALIFIGVLPILLGISMWLQQKLNPTPTDPAQAAIFAWMPWIFMFMLGGFASGLVLYWITNNTITFAQQYAIMTSHGHKPDLFGNIKAGMKRKPKAEPAPPAPAKKGPSKK